MAPSCTQDCARIVSDCGMAATIPPSHRPILHASESFLIAGWQMIRPQSTRKAQMKTILMLIVGLMLAVCGSMENHVRNRNAVDTICACP
jgi:hypothetical protein